MAMTEEAVNAPVSPEAPEAAPASESIGTRLSDWARGIWKPDSAPAPEPSAEPTPEPTSEPDSSPAETTPEPSAPFKSFATQAEYDRAVQSEADRRENVRKQREAQEAESQRQDRIRDLSGEVARMKANGETYTDEYTEKAGELADLVNGVHTEQDQERSRSQTLFEQAGRVTHLYDTSTLKGLTGILTDDERTALGSDLEKLAKAQQAAFTKGDGNALDAFGAREKSLETVAKRLLEVGAQRMAKSLRNDPEFRKEVAAELATEEPAHTVGAPTGGRTAYRTFDALVAAHAHGEIDNETYLRERRAFT